MVSIVRRCLSTPSGNCQLGCPLGSACAADAGARFGDSNASRINGSNHPSGLDCSVITGHMGFNLGTAVECLWRCDGQADPFPLLQMAKAYIDREIQKREKSA